MYNLYELIKAECEKKGSTVSGMCLNLGMSKSTMSDLKSGKKRSLSTETITKIADYLGVSTDYLLTGEQKEKPLVNDDPELTELLEELRTRPEQRMLLSVTKDATADEVRAIAEFITNLRKGSDDD